jgi:hypothetical protein
MNYKSGYWRGVVTGMMLGAGTAVLLTLKRDDEVGDLGESVADTIDESDNLDDALSGALDVAEEAADDVTQAHDVVDSV